MNTTWICNGLCVCTLRFIARTLSEHHRVMQGTVWPTDRNAPVSAILRHSHGSSGRQWLDFMERVYRNTFLCDRKMQRDIPRLPRMWLWFLHFNDLFEQIYLADNGPGCNSANSIKERLSTGFDLSNRYLWSFVQDWLHQIRPNSASLLIATNFKEKCHTVMCGYRRHFPTTLCHKVKREKNPLNWNQKFGKWEGGRKICRAHTLLPSYPKNRQEQSSDQARFSSARIRGHLTHDMDGQFSNITHCYVLLGYPLW